MPILYQLGRALVNSPQRNCVPTVKKGGRLPLPIRAGNRYARRQFSSRIWSISIYNTALYAAHKMCIRDRVYGENAQLKEVERAIAEEIGSDGFSCVFSAPYYLEILPADISKGDTLKWIADNLG